VNDRDSDRYRSDIEPIEVIFRRIAQKQQMVPRSIERGTSYQAVHDPAPPGARSPADVGPSVVLDVTTAKLPRRWLLTAIRVALLVARTIANALVRIIFR
jgi:hypothetical protein